MITVLAYGDSNTYGYNPRTGLRYSEDIRWTGLLSSHLGNGYRVIEEGCNGRTTIYDDPIDGWKNGLNYFKPCLHSHKPVDIVVMMLGTNDLKSVFGLSAQQIAEGAGVLVNTIQTFTLEKYGNQPKQDEIPQSKGDPSSCSISDPRLMDNSHLRNQQSF